MWTVCVDTNNPARFQYYQAVWTFTTLIASGNWTYQLLIPAREHLCGTGFKTTLIMQSTYLLGLITLKQMHVEMYVAGK